EDGIRDRNVTGVRRVLFRSETEAEEKTGETIEKETDVVVIGGGGAGFAAAVSAKEAGADVILLEKLASVGGNTLISGGEYAAPANELQEKEGIEDSKEQFEIGRAHV